MFMSQREAQFFLSELKSTDDVLEWGSGSSTKEISSRVNSVLSIENENLNNFYHPLISSDDQSHKENIRLKVLEKG